MAKVGIYPVEFTASIRLFLVTKTEVTIDTYALGLRFDAGTTYTVELEEGFVKETGANKFDSPAVSNLSQFTTNFTGPQVQVDEPAGNNVINNTFIRYTYNRQLLAGNGNYYLYRETGSPDEEVAVFNASDSTGRSTISNNQITLDVTGLMRAGETYYVLIDEGAVEDKDGLAAFGFDNDQEHSWTTAPSTGDFPDLSAVLTDAFAPSIAANITVNPFTDMSVTAAMTSAVNVIAGGVAPLFIDNTGFAARPNFTWNNAHSITAVASVSTIANFTTRNNPALINGNFALGTPYTEVNRAYAQTDSVYFGMTPDGTKYVRVFNDSTDAAPYLTYQIRIYDVNNNLLNAIPSTTSYRRVTIYPSFVHDNNNVYVSDDGYNTSQQNSDGTYTLGYVSGKILKFPFDYATNDTIEYLDDPDYENDNARNTEYFSDQARWTYMHIHGTNSLTIGDMPITNSELLIIYNVDTTDMSVTSTLIAPTVLASSISGLDRDIKGQAWNIMKVNKKILLAADFITDDYNGTKDYTRTLLKVYNGANFVTDLVIPSGYEFIPIANRCAINQNYAAIAMENTSTNKFEIKIYNLATGTILRTVDPSERGPSDSSYYTGSTSIGSGQYLYSEDIRLDDQNNLYYVRDYGYNNSVSYQSGTNPPIRNMPTLVTEIVNVVTGTYTDDFGLHGSISHPFNVYIPSNQQLYMSQVQYLEAPPADWAASGLLKRL
jgi:hypothetical protein